MDFTKVKDQFTIEPTQNLLVERGFLTQNAMDKKLNPSAYKLPGGSASNSV